MSVARLATYIEREQSRGVDIRLSDAQAETIVATLRWAKESEVALLEIAHLADDAELIEATGIALRALPIIDDRKPPAGEQIGEVASTGIRDAREPAPTMFLVENDRAVCVGGKWHGWLFWLHPNGNWVSARKLAETEPKIDPLFSMMEHPTAFSQADGGGK